jgi:hypothetical protein
MISCLRSCLAHRSWIHCKLCKISSTSSITQTLTAARATAASSLSPSSFSTTLFRGAIAGTVMGVIAGVAIIGGFCSFMGQPKRQKSTPDTRHCWGYTDSSHKFPSSYALLSSMSPSRRGKSHRKLALHLAQVRGLSGWSCLSGYHDG